MVVALNLGFTLNPSFFMDGGSKDVLPVVRRVFEVIRDSRNISLTIDPVCRPPQITVIPIQKNVNVTGSVIEIPVARPLFQLSHVRMWVAFLELVALCLSYVKIKWC
jgi:hypothetical protein